MSLFGKRFVLDSETRDWELAVAGWVTKNFGGIEQIRNTPLVLPNADFFPTQGEKGDQLASLLFRQVQDHAQMAEWPVRLESLPETPPDLVGNVVLERQGDQVPAGTIDFDNAENRDVIVRYNPKMVERPYELISTFAHELAHYLMWSADELPPGGMELHEQTTDALAVYMGFGVFLANSAYNFSGWSDSIGFGWSANRLGYLTERQLVFALAIFLTLKQLDPSTTERYLKKHLQKLLVRCYRELASIEHLEHETDAAWQRYDVD